MNDFALLRLIPRAMLMILGVVGCREIPPDPAPLSGCPVGNDLAGTCVGVPTQPLCNGDTCTDGISCSSIISASDDPEVEAATASAMAGTCIVLTPGVYGDVTLPPGVSLLGKSADLVTVGHVIIQSGTSGAVLRGVTAAKDGVEIQKSALGIQIVASRVQGSLGTGVTVGQGSQVIIISSEILGSALSGVNAVDPNSVTIQSSIIHGGKSPGLRVQCASGCDCPKPPKVSVSKTILSDNKIVGASLVGASATMSGVEIRDNAATDKNEGGGGIAVSGCSTFTASGVKVLDNSSFGILVDGSSATIGGPSAQEAVEIRRNVVGVWIRNVTDVQSVKLEGLTLAENRGVGLGTSGTSMGVVFRNSAVSGTKIASMRGLADGLESSQQIGDGLVWLDQSQMQIDGVTLSSNGRASVLIDGAVAAGSSIANVTLSGGDESRGIVQQNFSSGHETPIVGAGAPAITKSEMERFSVPLPPTLPTIN